MQPARLPDRDRQAAGDALAGLSAAPAATVRLRARYLWLEPGVAVGPAEVVLHEGRVAAVRRCRGSVPPRALLPGLIDAHAHLQLRPLDRSAPRRFVPWVRAVLAQRRRATPEADRRTALAALERLVRRGTTAVGEVDGSGASPRALAALPVAGRCYRELVGFDLDRPDAARLLDSRPAAGTRHCARGLSPHAPYSVSAALFRAAARAQRWLMVHAAETAEEQEFLRTGRGPFAELLHDLGRLPRGFCAPGCGAVRHLQRLGVLRHGTALVHCQHLEPRDAERIARAGASIVVCPGTIAYFGRECPDVTRWLALGIPVALGTDSPASNAEWSMTSELARASRHWPGLAPAQLLAMATVHGAAALGRRGLGRVRAGGRGDLLAVPARGKDADAVLESFVNGELPVQETWCFGRAQGGDGSVSC